MTRGQARHGQMVGAAMAKQRLRLCFSKGDSLKFISHLDLNRTWERAFRRAGLPLAYSQGFTPRPRFQIAAALPVGVSGRAEYLDLWLTTELSPGTVRERISAVLPAGLGVETVDEVELRAPSLQSQMRAAEYRVLVESEEPIEAIRTRVRAFLAVSSLLRQRPHKGKLRTYDLRPLVHDVWVEPGGLGQHVLTMWMQANSQGAGRPDELLEVLGLALAPHTIERTNLRFEFDK